MTRFDLLQNKARAFLAMALFVGLFTVVALPASAQIIDPPCTGKATHSTICQENIKQTVDNNRLFGPGGVLTKVISLLSAILGIIAVFVIIIGGVKYIISSGDSSGLNSAKNTILFAALGLAVAALAQTLVVFVLKKL